ncbi:hypothetical protein O6H91_15G074600 [Diphasiastrum complanatum]|uniref:Uncharacterized protein n=1 Tax=Diphasiastrum complanatum TaxID=34168 RepID=A0ACC2BJR4_DIPCM|nr:hypothetical protein O6H91_15G074600 [Diphasiastrum complanatum]
MGSETKMNPLRMVVFWVLALAVVFEKSVSAARMRGKLIKPESINGILDHIPKKHDIEGAQVQESFADVLLPIPDRLLKKQGYGIQVASEGTQVVSKNEGHQLWSTRKDVTSMSKLLSSTTKSSTTSHMEESNEIMITAPADEIDYSGPSTHPPPRGH